MHPALPSDSSEPWIGTRRTLLSILCQRQTNWLTHINLILLLPSLFQISFALHFYSLFHLPCCRRKPNYATHFCVELMRDKTKAQNMAASNRWRCKLISSHTEILFSMLVPSAFRIGDVNIYVLLSQAVNWLQYSRAPLYLPHRVLAELRLLTNSQTICNFLIYLLWLAAAHAYKLEYMTHPVADMNGSTLGLSLPCDRSRRELTCAASNKQRQI